MGVWGRGLAHGSHFASSSVDSAAFLRHSPCTPTMRGFCTVVGGRPASGTPEALAHGGQNHATPGGSYLPEAPDQPRPVEKLHPSVRPVGVLRVWPVHLRNWLFSILLNDD